ncbi:hypothetical protein [Thalassotalea crassostreae]|uniref:hypothetical protein n=1 Tax=Thalassotalea crassostreae TaxID=1763536 RepID=UPI00083969A6|nr:hypothetical protein [Thalassotalea crassostreae]
MKKTPLKTLALLLSLTTPPTFAEDNDFEVTQPDVSYVSAILDNCTYVTDTPEATNSEQAILACVNSELKLSAYSTFSSYKKLIEFITPKESS